MFGSSIPGDKNKNGTPVVIWNVDVYDVKRIRKSEYEFTVTSKKLYNTIFVSFYREFFTELLYTNLYSI